MGVMFLKIVDSFTPINFMKEKEGSIMKVPIEQDLFLVMSDLRPEEQLAIIKAIGFYPEEPAEGWPKSNTWVAIRRILDKKLEMRERIAERNRINGRKHVSKKNAQPKQEQVSQSTKNTEKSPQSDEQLNLFNELAREKSKESVKRFIPPTLDEWLEFCREKNLDQQTMKNAWESYNVANWHDSRGAPIKNWKLKILQVWANHSTNFNKAKFREKTAQEQRFEAYADFLSRHKEDANATPNFNFN